MSILGQFNLSGAQTGMKECRVDPEEMLQHARGKKAAALRLKSAIYEAQQSLYVEIPNGPSTLLAFIGALDVEAMNAARDEARWLAEIDKK